MFKNTASQKLTVLAFADAGHASLDAGEPVTGDAANITLKIEQDDDGTQSASDDTNPTEVEDGQYRFDLTQAETNGDKLTFYPESSTAGVQVVALPSNVIYTRPPNFAEMGIESDGDLTKVNTLDGHTAQTGDSYSYLDTNLGAAGANASAIPWNSSWDAEVQSECADALAAFSWSGITISAVSGAVGSVTGSVGSISGITFPTNFSDLAITETDGYITVGTNNDKTGYSISGTKTTLDALNDIDGTGLTVDLNADQSGVTIGTVTTNSDMRGTDSALLAANVPTNFAALGINASGHVTRVVLVDTTTANTDMVGASEIRSAIGMSSANLDTQLSDIDSAVDGISVGTSPQLLQSTTIGTVNSQTSITLSSGSSDDSAYKNQLAVIVDQSTSTQKAVCNITSYSGSTKALTFNESPAFTIASGDDIHILAVSKTTLTDDVVNSLSGSVVRSTGPQWSGYQFNGPFVVGDDYSGGNAVSVTIENWSGDQAISSADAIKLSGTKTVNGTTTGFSWSLDPGSVTVDGTTTTILVDPNASETGAVEAGEYTADIRAQWTSPGETYSIVQPDFKVELVDPVSTF